MKAARAEAPAGPRTQKFGARATPEAPVTRPRENTIVRTSYFAGFGFCFAARIVRGLFSGSGNTAHGTAPERPATQTVTSQRQKAAPIPIAQRRASGEVRPRAFSLVGIVLRVRNWVRNRVIAFSERLRTFIATLSARRDGVWEYALVTIAYWGLTITDGAIRMLVLFQFYLMGYSALQIASLFLFYEIFGVITNLFGGWIGANFGLRVTLFGGLATQIVALGMLALLSPAWPTWLIVGYVMFSQALSGIAKDLTKMSSKSAIKAVIPKDQEVMMYKWVSLLTGSKNSLKGLGFFVGALLLTLAGFNMSLLIMAGGLAWLLHALWRHLPKNLGRAKEKAKFRSMFSMDRRVNILSAARFFLFGARDVWFVVALPVYLSAMFGWSPLVVGAYLALWTIGYGVVQSIAPKFIAAKKGETPKAYTVVFWSIVLTAVPVAIAMALGIGFVPGLSIAGGLAIFGVIFAVNSAVHSYMIVHYAESEKVAMTIGFYYMANAGGRLIGTVLSGLVYQVAGLVGCLWISAFFVGAAALISTGLTLPEGKRVINARQEPFGFLVPAYSGEY
jgi:MFS family permease